MVALVATTSKLSPAARRSEMKPCAAQSPALSPRPGISTSSVLARAGAAAAIALGVAAAPAPNTSRRSRTRRSNSDDSDDDGRAPHSTSAFP